MKVVGQTRGLFEEGVEHVLIKLIVSDEGNVSVFCDVCHRLAVGAVA